VYEVASSREARQQADQHPPVARRALADAVERLRADPWQGAPYLPGYPSAYRML
jgi:hypothetical protein